MWCSNHHDGPTSLTLINTPLSNNPLDRLLRETIQSKARSTIDFHERKYEMIKRFHYEDSGVVLQLFQRAEEDLRGDLEVALHALSANIECISYCIEFLIHHDDAYRKLLKMAIRDDGHYLQLVQNTELAKDRELVFLACSSTAEAIQYADESLRNDKEFVLKVIKECPGNPNAYIGDDLTNDKEVALACVSVDGDAFRYFSDDIRNDREVFLLAIKTEPCW